jgi:hypothetical protein
MRIGKIAMRVVIIHGINDVRLDIGVPMEFDTDASA